MALKGDTPRTPVVRQDYRPPSWLIDTTVLTLDLDPEQTRVRASLRVRRNPDADDPGAPLELFGSGLETRSVAIDGQPVPEHSYRIEGERMVLDEVPDPACITTEVWLSPARNTALEGLYQSGASLLTQCEAEGFRKITWFGDRPDIMSTFRVRLEADRTAYPVLLGNGNRIDSGALDDGRHYAVWDDPFPKPSYLFALVAGDLECISEPFTTASGREIELKVYSERANLGQLDHAMNSLKKAMAWDEQRYGLEYDLDVYHIVATHDFNMGAMENKSLNIFNARYVLADPESATDADYEGVEGVIAHEYFHNWTGNRVTCRDWFQLTLKEGLTVYRDQEFSADMQSRSVKRIQDVRALMSRQFPEDAGPMAHSIRPERYVEISNFYTPTVYEKGAEIVRMYETRLGREGFRRGMDLYFERHDGQAVTCDDFRAAMADANGADLDQFERWYRQVGTPKVAVRADWSEADGSLELVLTQSLPEHADNRDLGPLAIPFHIGFLSSGGTSLTLPLAEPSQPAAETHEIVLTEAETRIRVAGFDERPVVSLLRGYPAPIQLEHDWSASELAILLAFDPDPVARWLAGRSLAARALAEAIDAIRSDRTPEPPELLVAAWKRVLESASDDPALAAELLQLPTEAELARDYSPVPVDEIHAARREVVRALGQSLHGEIESVLERFAPAGAWQFQPADVARRSLHNNLLGLAVAAGTPGAAERAARQYRDADNMTDRFSALSAVVRSGDAGASELLGDFEQRFSDNPLVMDKWFAVQAQVGRTDTVEKIRSLMEHPAFSLKNPNKVRALIASFGMHNPVAFHRADGAGYRLVGEVIEALDALNPQVAARLAAVFNRWNEFDAARAQAMRDILKSIKSRKELSADVDEIVTAALKRGPAGQKTG